MKVKIFEDGKVKTWLLIDNNNILTIRTYDKYLQKDNIVILSRKGKRYLKKLLEDK